MIYLLGAALLVLAYRIFRGVGRERRPRQEPDGARSCGSVYPVTGEFHGGRWFVKEDGRRYATPIFLCLAAIVFADIAFAIDSIPAAFAITRDPLLIWMGNVFALLGLRALFVLVESLIARFRYLDETIAVVLGLVGVKLLIEDLVKIGPLPSLGRDRRGLRDRDRPLGARRQRATRTPSSNARSAWSDPRRMGRAQSGAGEADRPGRLALALSQGRAYGRAPAAARARARRSSHCAPTSAIQASASDIGAGVGR